MATDGEFLLGLLEQVGPKVSARHRKIRRVLNRHPPVIPDQHSGLNPVGDGLLTRLRFPKLAELRGEAGLAPADRDGALERSKVRFIHEARDYTNSFVRVNNSICVTANKEACMVLAMKKSTVVRLPTRPKRAKKTPPNPLGADGKTLSQRLEIAMAYKSGRTGFTYTEKQLIIDANRVMGCPEDAPQISQQSVNNIIRGIVARSNFTPYLAEACGVRTLWLSHGITPMIG